MWRIVNLGGKWYAIKIDSVEDDLENIEIMTDEGNLVVLHDDLEDAANILKVDVSDIEVVEAE